MSVRSRSQLADVADPAWPGLLRLLGRPGVVVLRPPPTTGDVLYRLQVTARSALGALALNCGAIVIDHGWLRILGGGAGGLPDLATANGFRDPSLAPAAPGHIDVAYDVLGGVFAINLGGLPGTLGEVDYFAPWALEWKSLGFGLAAFVEWAASGETAAFYSAVRWPGWPAEVDGLGLDEGLRIYPPLWSDEGRDIACAERTPALLRDVVSYYQELADDLGPTRDGPKHAK